MKKERESRQPEQVKLIRIDADIEARTGRQEAGGVRIFRFVMISSATSAVVPRLWQLAFATCLRA